MRIIKVLLLALGFFTTDVLAKQITNHLAIYQSNCFTQAIIYSLSYNTQPKILASATADSISEVDLLGNSGNLKFTDGAASLMACCLTKLAVNYALETMSDAPINIESLVIGIAGYNTFKNDLYDTNTTRSTHFINLLYQALKKNQYICNNDFINVMRDTDLMNEISCQLVQQKVITSKNTDTNYSYNNVYTFVLSSLFVGLKADTNFSNKAKEIYLTNNDGGYYNLGKNTSELFANTTDNTNLTDNKVQQLINESALSKQLLTTRNYTLSYWLQQYGRNNARGLAIVEYVLNTIKTTTKINNNNKSNYLAKRYKQTINLPVTTPVATQQQTLESMISKDNSIAVAQKHVLDLIESSINFIENLILTDESEFSIQEDDIIIISGELFRSKFIRDNYLKILEETISNITIKNRIHLISQQDFIYGLALAGTFIKNYCYSDISGSATNQTLDDSESSEDLAEDAYLFEDSSYDDSDVFHSDSSTESSE